MEYEKFIDRQETEINGFKVATSKIPAIEAQEIYGDIVRETTETGDIGMTFLPRNVAYRLLAYAAYLNPENNVWWVLDNEDAIDRVCPDVQTLIKLETLMIRRNFAFLFDGSLRRLLAEIRGEAQDTSKQK